MRKSVHFVGHSRVYVSRCTIQRMWRMQNSEAPHYAAFSLKDAHVHPWNYKGNGGIAPRILNLGTKRTWVVSFTRLPLYPWWAPEPFCTRWGRKVYLVNVWNRTTIPWSSSLYPSHCTDWVIPLTHSVLVLCSVLRHHQFLFFHPHFSLLRIM